MPATIVRKKAHAGWNEPGTVFFGYTRDELLASVLIACGLIITLIPTSDQKHQEGSAPILGFV